LEALSVTVSVPVRVPVAVGLKLTVIVHVPLEASVCGDIGHVDVSEKSPVVEMLVIVTGVVLLVRVRLTELENPIASDPKFLLVWLRV
jgi:hypothetical protein